MCVHSSMKQLDKVINDTINFIKPKRTFFESKIYDLYQGDALFCNNSLDSQILVWQVYVNFWPQLYMYVREECKITTLS